MGFLLILALTLTAAAAGEGYTPLGPSDVQSFVKNWQPQTRPLCAAIQNERQWGAVMHPAPVMGPHKPFAPGSSFWNAHALLVVARVSGGSGGTEDTLRIRSVRRVAGVMTLDERFTPNPPASWTVKLWTAAAVAKPLPRTVRFVENGRTICDLHPSAGQWLLPKR